MYKKNQKIKKKCVISANDILRITNMSERYGQDLLCRIKKYYKKGKHQFVTVKEFSKFSGIPVEEIEEYL
ncbi:hypothetical protein KI659_16635 [Litoribacter alkaliphilus]|uniref:Uncharacterized protein n=1 Tax=Litoribacter ruber TaxID=702568 RepID=A0AAP2CK54_9BACT|nr:MULTISPECIES: hypothetical protein [Litoribacter]MBS9525647.1 hypothetical protein [Litoribacter alkaliphilus]